jgi:CBS domain-containing protein
MKKVRDFITRDLTSVTLDTPLKEVAEILSWRGISGVPVVDGKNEVIGFISEKDLITSLFPEQVRIENPDVIRIDNLAQIVKKLTSVGEARVTDYMNTNIICVSEETPISDIAGIILKKGIKRLPVLRDKRLVGVIDRANLVRVMFERGSLE